MIWLLLFNVTATTEIDTDLHTLDLHDALPICSASQSSIMAAERKAAVGVALPCPAMAGALPGQGGNTARSAPMAPEGAMPSPPMRPAARSERISPYMFSVTITSKLQGCLMRSSALAST